MKEAIQKAIEGGYKMKIRDYGGIIKDEKLITPEVMQDIQDFVKDKWLYADIWSDPLFWQCLIKGADLDVGYIFLIHYFADEVIIGRKEAEKFFKGLLK